MRNRGSSKKNLVSAAEFPGGVVSMVSKLYFPEGEEKKRGWDRYPRQVSYKEENCDDNVDRGTDRYAEYAKNDAQNPSHDGIVLVQRLKKVCDRYFDRKRPVHMFERRDKNVRDHAGTAHVPMPEEIENAVKEAMEEVSECEIIHGFIVARYFPSSWFLFYIPPH
jgi:hypothetical protein